MEFPDLAANLERVRDRISRARERSGLSHEVTIVAVTKGHPAGAIAAAARVGIADIGENRVQEARDKWDAVGGHQVRWHLIGHLQTNKARHVPRVFTLVHSVDSVKLVRALDGEAGKRLEPGGVLDVLLQVNVSGEPQKSGCNPDEAEEIAGAVSLASALRLRGLMTMAPYTQDERVVGRTFTAARELRDRLGKDYDVPVLSMGMSGDYELAVREGANLVRLGTVLFGERPR